MSFYLSSRMSRVHETLDSILGGSQASWHTFGKWSQEFKGQSELHETSLKTTKVPIKGKERKERD